MKTRYFLKKNNACRKTLREQRQDTLNELEPHHFFLHNMCLKKGRIPLLKHDVYLALLFQPFGRHTAYMQPYLFPKIQIDVYFAFFTLLQKFSMNWFAIWSRYIGNFAHIGTNTCFQENHFHVEHVLKGFHSYILLPFFRYFFGGALHSYLWNWFCIHVKQVQYALM